MSFGIPSNPSLSDSLITKCFQKLHLTLTHIFNPATELAPLWIDKTTRKKKFKKEGEKALPFSFQLCVAKYMQQDEGRGGKANFISSATYLGNISKRSFAQDYQ